MSTIDWLLPLILIQSVVRQLRGRRLGLFALTWPIAFVAWAGYTYIRGFPPEPSDLTLVVGCCVLGLALGSLAGSTSMVFRRGDGQLMIRSTPWAVVFWTLGTIGRLVFALYATHGGGPAIGRFSTEHHLTLGAWASALTGMALAEALGRTAVLAPRARSAPPAPLTPDLRTAPPPS